jgi:hypothetical protein
MLTEVVSKMPMARSREKEGHSPVVGQTNHATKAPSFDSEEFPGVDPEETERAYATARSFAPQEVVQQRKGRLCLDRDHERGERLASSQSLVAGCPVYTGGPYFKSLGRNGGTGVCDREDHGRA